MREAYPAPTRAAVLAGGHTGYRVHSSGLHVTLAIVGQHAPDLYKSPVGGQTPGLPAAAIVAENGKSITVSPSESVLLRSESVSETVNRYRFSV